MEHVKMDDLTEQQLEGMRHGYYCPGCDNFLTEEEYEPEPSYECNNCGMEFLRSESPYESHRCDCGKFASKKAEVACPNCYEEMEEVDAAERDGGIVVVELS